MSKIIKKNEADKRVKTFSNFFHKNNFYSEEDETQKHINKIKQLRIEAENEAEQIINEAKKKALVEEQNGFEEGIRRGLEGLKPLEETLKALIAELKDFKEIYPLKLEPEIIKLVVSISAKIIKDKLEDDKEIVLRNFREAFSEVTDREFIKIRVNDKDYEIMQKFKSELIKSFHDIKNVEIVMDASVDRGGCIIDTREGSIDATIKNQFKKLHGLISCEAVSSEMKVFL